MAELAKEDMDAVLIIPRWSYSRRRTSGDFWPWSSWRHFGLRRFFVSPPLGKVVVGTVLGQSSPFSLRVEVLSFVLLLLLLSLLF
jgi:hypothetical protein